MFKPIPKDGAPAPKAKEAVKTPEKPKASRVAPYRWPGEAPQGRGDFNRVGEEDFSGRTTSNFMRR
jgi:hypothetical protein